MINADLFLTEGGNLGIELTPEQQWQNQMVTDLFSWFFSFDISNDVVQAGALLQTHDGVVTIAGQLSTPTVTSEVRPQIFFGPEGKWIRVVLELTLTDTIPGAPALGWLISAATMDTSSSERAASPGFAGQLNLPAELPTIDPRAGAVGQLDDSGVWTKIDNPIPAPTEPTTSTVPPTTSEPATTPTIAESVAPPSTLSNSTAGQGGAGGGAGAGGGGGGSRAFWVFSIVAFLLMITMFLYLRGRRTRRRGLDIEDGSLHLDTPTWDLPTELGELYTELSDAERRQAIKDFAAVEDKKAYIEYFKALQKYHAGQGGPTPPDKPAGI